MSEIIDKGFVGTYIKFQPAFKCVLPLIILPNQLTVMKELHSVGYKGSILKTTSCYDYAPLQASQVTMSATTFKKAY